MKEINLEQIILETSDCEDIYTFQETTVASLELIKEIMLEFGKQLLELVAENAEIEGFEFKEDWMKEPFNMRQDELGNIIAISKKSILDTINQVK